MEKLIKIELAILYSSLSLLVACSGAGKGSDPGLVSNNPEQEEISLHEEGEEDVIVLDENIQNEIEESPEIVTGIVADSVYDDQTEMSEYNKSIKKDLNSVYSANYEKYTVKKGDTLGLIAFSIYGQFRKWKQIYLDNEEQLDSDIIRPGMVLKYQVPEESPVSEKKGSPYLIVRNDSLRIISGKVYNGETKHWKYVWDNNRKLIWDPNLIFAGFTLYYLPLEKEMAHRDLANQ